MKKSNAVIIAVFLTLTIILIGCSKKEPTTSVEDEGALVEAQIPDETDEKDTEDEANEDSSQNIEEVVKKEGIPSPLSGIYGPKEKIERRPVAIMFDNHPKARWQAGLGQAEIVYEFLVEAPYARYMGIFLLNDPKQIGPIRSSRPYFVTTLLEYDPVYVRVGGSEAAKADIKELKVADIDALNSSSRVFWRYTKTGKKEPNNMYSSMERIREAQEERGYRLTGNYDKFKFNETDTEIQGKNAEVIQINYYSDNTTKYVYEKETKVYKRYKDGKLHIDELDNKEITAKNIIIQKAKTKVIDNVGRLSINLVGEGTGTYITNGSAIPITWKKLDRQSKTVYYNEDGEEIYLNPGITWIQVTTLETNIIIE